MIVGLGTDLVELARLERSLAKPEFKKLVFTEEEIGYCDRQAKSIASYAGRFAAKEAIFKAFGTGWSGEMKLTEVCVLNNDEGKPYFKLSGEVQRVAESVEATNIHLSISHSETVAVATVIIEK